MPLTARSFVVQRLPGGYGGRVGPYTGFQLGPALGVGPLSANRMVWARPAFRNMAPVIRPILAPVRGPVGKGVATVARPLAAHPGAFLRRFTGYVAAQPPAGHFFFRQQRGRIPPARTMIQQILGPQPVVVPIHISEMYLRPNNRYDANPPEWMGI